MKPYNLFLILAAAAVATAFVSTSTSGSRHEGIQQKSESFFSLPGYVTGTAVKDLRASTDDDAFTTTASSEGKIASVPDFSDQLLDAIGYNATAASIILMEINRMREGGIPQEGTDAFLNLLLYSGPDAKSFPFWTRSKRLARFSRRARLASLRRTLDVTTPPPSESENLELKEEEQALQRRRRRALVTILRSLSTLENDEKKTPAIVLLERKAVVDERQGDNLRDRLPEGLETPTYKVLANAKKTNIEIREYQPYSVCAVSMTKPRPETKPKTDAKAQMPEMGGASSFGALAGYLFGKNDKSTAMKMTTPVFTTPTFSDNDDRQMEFVLPSDYWQSTDLTKAPKPLEGSGVTLQIRDADQRAVIMFGGFASKKEVEKRKEQLMETIAKEFADWQAVENSDGVGTPSFTLAQYNDPFTAPWKRLNEVSISVVPKTSLRAE